MKTMNHTIAARSLPYSLEAEMFQPTTSRIFACLMLTAGASVLSLAGLGKDAAPTTSSTTANSKAWPLFRGDPLSSGVAHTTLPDKPELVWKFEVKDGAFDSTAAIADGVVYIGDMDGKLYAINLATGNEIWHQKFEAGFIAAPAVKNGYLYLGDMDGKCYCIDAKTGKAKWSFPAEAEVDSSANFWKDNVLFASQDRNLYCMNAVDGKQVWKFAIEDQIRCTPTVVGDRAFVAGCDGKLHIIDLLKGASTASVEIGSPTLITPAVLGDHVFFGTEANVFFCVNWKEAKEAWKVEDNSSTQGYRSSPAVTAGLVVVGSRNKEVQAFNPENGKELWRFPTKQRIESSPVIVGNRVFIGSADGRLYALSAKDGTEVWQAQCTGGFTGSPAVADGKLVIASDRGVVYCFGPKK
jgi:outer membrane protein assembly factor BamB